MLKGLETVVYYVDDVVAARDWYKKVLGLEPNYDTPYYVGFTVAGDELGLHPTDEKSIRAGVQGHVAHWTVDDIHAAVARFVEHGAKVHKAPDDVGGGIVVASVLDPFGNALGLIQNPNSPNRR